jgi:hypothetical protein
LVYGILIFIDQYNPQLVSPHFKQSLTFHQLQTFEECIVLISSLHSFRYGVNRLLLQNIKEENQYIGIADKLKNLVFFGQFPHDKMLPKKIKEKLRGSYYLTSSND